MTNEKIKEILDRCNGRFGWVQIHMDTEENYLLMPLADLIELLEKQLPKPIYEHIDTRLIYKVRYDKFRCSECVFTTKFTDGHIAQYKNCPQCGRRLSGEVTECTINLPVKKIKGDYSCLNKSSKLTNYK